MTKFKMSLQAKLVSFVLLVVSFSIAAAYTSIQNAKKIAADYRGIAIKNLPGSVAAATMRGVSKDTRALVFKSNFSGQSKDELETIIEKLSDLKDQFELTLSEYQALPFVEGESLYFEKVKTDWSGLQESVGEIVRLRKEGHKDADQKIKTEISGRFKARYSEFTDAINQLVTFQQEVASRSREGAEQTEVSSMKILWVINAINLLMGMIAVIYSYSFGVKLSKDLIGFSKQLRTVAESIFNNSNSVSSSSQSVAQQNDQLVAAIQETSAAVTEISATLERTGQSAEEAQNLSRDSQEQVSQGTQTINLLHEDFNKFNRHNEDLFRQVLSTMAQMDHLVEIINNVAQKTSVINEIVFQTKLLSFNASVEAARAGEHGRGFSVVAEEVGELAKMSGTAADEITKLIGRSLVEVQAIGKEARDSLTKGMKLSETETQEILSEVDQSKAFFGKINTESKQVAEQVSHITGSVLEQLSAMKEIGTAIRSLETTSELNLQAAKETASAGSSLKSEVIQLRQIVTNLVTVVVGSDTSGAEQLDIVKNTEQNEIESRAA